MFQFLAILTPSLHLITKLFQIIINYQSKTLKWNICNKSTVILKIRYYSGYQRHQNTILDTNFGSRMCFEKGSAIEC